MSNERIIMKLTFFKKIVIIFLCSFVVGSGIVFLVQPRLRSITDPFEGSRELLRASWAVVADHFTEPIEGIKELGFSGYIQDQIASVQPSPQGEVFENYREFFQNASRKNFLGLGALFSLDHKFPTKYVQQTENAQEMTDQNGLTRKVIFKKVEEFNGNERSYYKLIENDRVIFREIKAEGWSILHDLPAQMRADGVDQVFVRLLEQELSVVNYYLQKAQNGQGYGFSLDDLRVFVAPWAFSPIFAGYNVVAGFTRAWGIEH